MCGIAGVVGGGTDDHERVAAMAARLAHRGPDRTIVRGFEGCVLGHTRLRIVDLSEAGDQPLANEDNSVHVIFNGELYNHPELRDELIARGHRFRSRTDTEVLVHLYEDLGDGLVDRLRGMFAFALWDAPRQRLLLARDRLGIKPLYLRVDGRTLAFASESRVLAQPGDPLNDEAVAGYLRTGWVQGPATVHRTVRELEAGHVAVWSDGALSTRRYWHPQPGGRDDRALADVLTDAVQRHLIADVPVGLFLSSGVDSIAVAELAQRSGADVAAYTVAIGGARDETADARQAANALGLRHVVVPVHAEEILDDLGTVVGALDQPSVDGPNTFVVSRAVRAAGPVVALSGLGGDELFGGYSTFRHVPRLHAASRALPRPVRATAGAVLGRSRDDRVRRASGAIAAGGWAAAYVGVRGLFTADEVRAVWPGAPAPLMPDEPSAGAQVTRLELAAYLPHQLLRDTDAMSMAHSLEVRVPLLDDEVVAWALANPARVAPGRGKAALAAAAGPVTTAAAARPKMTFTLPFDGWLRGPWQERSRAAVESLGDGSYGFDRRALVTMLDAFNARRLGWRPVWALTVLGEWLGSRQAA